MYSLDLVRGFLQARSRTHVVTTKPRNGRKSLPQTPRSIKRSYCSASSSNPIPFRETTNKKLANVARVKPDGTTGRFFKKASVTNTPSGWEVEIDGYAITSKGGSVIKYPSEEIAVAVAADWEFMHQRIDPTRMPLYTFSSLATDLTPTVKEMHLRTLQQNFEDDILCGRTDTPPAALKAAWQQYHDPIIQWFCNEFEMDFEVGSTMYVRQPRRSCRLIEKALKPLDDWAVIGLANSVETTLSLITTLALWNNIITVEHATNAVRAEYLINEAAWGDIPGTSDLRRSHFMMDLYSSTFFLQALPSAPINRQWLKDKGIESKALRRE